MNIKKLKTNCFVFSGITFIVYILFIILGQKDGVFVQCLPLVTIIFYGCGFVLDGVEDENS